MATTLKQFASIITGTIGNKPRRRNLVVEQDLLGDNLVHHHARRHDATSGVGNLHHFQKALDRTVFTVASVQTDKSHIGSNFTQLGW